MSPAGVGDCGPSEEEREHGVGHGRQDGEEVALDADDAGAAGGVEVAEEGHLVVGQELGEHPDSGRYVHGVTGKVQKAKAPSNERS